MWVQGDLGRGVVCWDESDVAARGRKWFVTDKEDDDADAEEVCIDCIA